MHIFCPPLPSLGSYENPISIPEHAPVALPLCCPITCYHSKFPSIRRAEECRCFIPKPVEISLPPPPPSIRVPCCMIPLVWPRCAAVTIPLDIDYLFFSHPGLGLINLGGLVVHPMQESASCRCGISLVGSSPFPPYSHMHHRQPMHEATNQAIE